MATRKTKTSNSGTRAERVQISGDALPRKTLEEAERVARVIHDNYAGKQASWDDIANGLEQAPKNAKTKYLIWSASAYGLIQKHDENSRYSLAETGRKIVAPTFDGENMEGRRKAAMTPTVLSKFFSEYANHPVPDSQHFANVLENKFGVPRDRTTEAADLILANGKHAGLLAERDGRLAVTTSGDQRTSQPSLNVPAADVEAA